MTPPTHVYGCAMPPGTGLLGRAVECDELDRAVRVVRDGGHHQVLVVRGEAGIGKSTLLDYISTRAQGFRVARVAGVESEMELAFAGLHQLCAPMLGALEKLPVPQQDALSIAFGLSVGVPPDRFLVGLALLSLLAEVAEEQPLLCLVDDAQWLDPTSAQLLAFAARRLLAERITIVIAVRDSAGGDQFGGLRQLVVSSLNNKDANALLDTSITGTVDDTVRRRILGEAGGNPLALIEFPLGLTPADIAGGFGLPLVVPLAGRIEQGFLERLRALSGDANSLLLIAAADPTGDVPLLWRAAALLGLASDAAIEAKSTGLIEFNGRVWFRHPLVRSAVYRAALPEERRRVHQALADCTDPTRDPDRRAWHGAHAAIGPDEAVAIELDRSADRAQARGGLAAAAAFLERATMLTPDPVRRAQRGLAAARVMREIGSLDAALQLLDTVDDGPSDPLHEAHVERLRGQVAFDQRRPGDATLLLLDAASRLETLDARASRETYLEALGASMWADDFEGVSGAQAVAEAARGAPPSADVSNAVDVVIEALAMRVTDGYVAAAPAMVRALEAVRALLRSDEGAHWLWLAGNRAGGLLAFEVWDFEARRELALRQVQLARATGELVQLQFALNFLGNTLVLAGELTEAAVVIEEDRLIGVAIGNMHIAAYSALAVNAWCGGDESTVRSTERSLKEVAENGRGRVLMFATYAMAVLYNGLGQYDDACDAAWRLFQRDPLGFGPTVLPELVEAASRSGNTERLQSAVGWLSERSQATPTDWVLGTFAYARALASDGDVAEIAYVEAIERLERSTVRVHLARAQLAYGEWLRRRGRRIDARLQLRAAHEMLSTMGVELFAERARRELLATGEKVRKRSIERRDDLTAQEAQIARLASEGLTNPEIGSQLFISARTVEWHLRKVFTKLGVTSRKELQAALTGGQSAG